MFPVVEKPVAYLLLYRPHSGQVLPPQLHGTLIGQPISQLCLTHQRPENQRNPSLSMGVSPRWLWV